MTDEISPSDDTTPDLEPTTASEVPAAPAAAAEAISTPAAPTAPRGRTRELMAAGAAGLLVVGGLAGFGIGRATDGGNDGPRFTRNGQFRPGQQGYGRPGQRGPGGFGGQGNGPQGQGTAPDGQSGSQSGSQAPADGQGSDGT